MVVQCRRGSGNGARTHWTWTGDLSLLEVVRAEKGALDGYAIVNAFLSCSTVLRLVERYAMFDVCFGLADGIRYAIPEMMNREPLSPQDSSLAAVIRPGVALSAGQNTLPRATHDARSRALGACSRMHPAAPMLSIFRAPKRCLRWRYSLFDPTAVW